MIPDLSIIRTRGSYGIESPLVTIEVHISNGLPGLSIVGLPETAVKESKDRVRSAIINSGMIFPMRRITINLAPADLPKKDGGRFDLPIAIGILIASGQIRCDSTDAYEFAGELALDGSLRGFNGIVPMTIATRRSDKSLIVPTDNANDASLINGASVYAFNSLLDVSNFISGRTKCDRYMSNISHSVGDIDIDINDIRGQQHAKRALEIAAIGCHSLLMIGPPGTGKTMLANRIISIMPEMTIEEFLETATIHSICGQDIGKNMFARPFRSPHHTSSNVSIVGGGNPPVPGEISLAHNGVLFLDELPEFKRCVLEAMREPLESGHVTVARASHHVKFPACFQFIAAMNPCPCGKYDVKNPCKCTYEQISRYQNRISGPLLDRIDMQIDVPVVPKDVLINDSYIEKKKNGNINNDNNMYESSKSVLNRVKEIRLLQVERSGKLNCRLTNKDVEKYCKISTNAKKFLENAMDRLNISARSYYRILKISRTIADIEKQNIIEVQHIAESISYRNKLQTRFKSRE